MLYHQAVLLFVLRSVRDILQFRSIAAMNSTKKDIANANIYSVCNGDIRTGVSIDHRKLLQSGAKVTVDGNHLDVDIDLDQDNVDIYKSKGHIIPADEVLQMNNATGVKIPVQHRDEFPAGQELPSSDFLKALHYYTSRRYSYRKGFKQSMDETALLSFGLLTELWINQAIDANAARLFVLNEDNEEEQGSESDRYGDSESDSVSCDNIESTSDLNSDINSDSSDSA